MRKHPENPTNPDIAAIQWFPGMRPDLLLALVKPSTKAIIITGTALGTVATDFDPTIRELTDRGVVVFVLSDNIREKHGTLRIIDQVQTENARAGAAWAAEVKRRRKEIDRALRKWRKSL